MPDSGCVLNEYCFLDTGYWLDWNQAFWKRSKPCHEGWDRDVQEVCRSTEFVVQSLFLARCFTHSDFPHAKGWGVQIVTLLRFSSLHDTLEKLKPCFLFSPMKAGRALWRVWLRKPTCSISYISGRTEFIKIFHVKDKQGAKRYRRHGTDEACLWSSLIALAGFSPVPLCQVLSFPFPDQVKLFKYRAYLHMFFNLVCLSGS